MIIRARRAAAATKAIEERQKEIELAAQAERWAGAAAAVVQAGGGGTGVKERGLPKNGGN